MKSWEVYQKRLQRAEKGRRLFQKLPLLVAVAACLIMTLTFIFYSGPRIHAKLMEADHEVLNVGGIGDSAPVGFSKDDLPSLLKDLKLSPSPGTGGYALTKDGLKFIVSTSIEASLQDYIVRLLKRSLTHQAAVVVLRPDNGQVLAMVSYGKPGRINRDNLCLRADMPAASLFKIVSAAAAIEARNFTPDKAFFYRGGKYTLYKSQLKQNRGRYTNETSFREAFSGSNNPVFGKIGIYDLGRELMREYAGRFLFNREIPFDLPLGISTIEVPEDNFGLAEIASGFNKKTLLSPLHAALITSAVANNGTIMEPWLVREIKDERGRVFYRAKPSGLSKPIKEGTADKLKILLRDTVIYGTGRKAFRPLKRKKQFNDIDLGAKTGTINDSLDQYKYDWLTAYALPGNGGEGIAIAVLAIHGKKLGIRAKDLARYIINYRFTS